MTGTIKNMPAKCLGRFGFYSLVRFKIDIKDIDLLFIAELLGSAIVVNDAVGGVVISVEPALRQNVGLIKSLTDKCIKKDGLVIAEIRRPSLWSSRSEYYIGGAKLKTQELNEKWSTQISSPDFSWTVSYKENRSSFSFNEKDLLIPCMAFCLNAHTQIHGPTT